MSFKDIEKPMDPFPVEWLKTRNGMFIDEFSDVNSSEKSLMKMWNTFFMDLKPLGNIHVNDACLLFTQKSKLTILHENLRNNFLCHLLNLYRSNLISNECIIECISHIDHNK
ncbi:hypothetical protein O9G_005242 [Rozella allomycis CSF55]|uniref:Polycomb protein VEFS-Box domain-containing protein n=1 Tax=Rozella allomycis (strain CSF55) TaxID=988480 RepID=A0A075B488_ROZAC|nr:hypothetical protein O9G_005242 [Rozella allomycis CSF55]|eukprot:EPZ36105.1 hypothetical protein O9G_005242 [Rozella allomycis CSF55]